MRLSELVIIYLAAAAPFGVGHFLNRPPRTRNSRAVAATACLALAWPFAVVAKLLARARREGTNHENGADDIALHDEARVNRTKRALLTSLRRVEDVLSGPDGVQGETYRHVMFEARENVERYVGLTKAAVGLKVNGSPSASELELGRIAGRRGDDLLLAGRCIHRRNVTRLLAHRDNARVALLHSLAEVRETAACMRRAQASGEAARAMSGEVLQVYSQAVELFSSLEDRQAEVAAARLLDAEDARRRKFDDAAHGETSQDARERAQGGEPCLPSHTYNPQPQTLQQKTTLAPQG